MEFAEAGVDGKGVEVAEKSRENKACPGAELRKEPSMGW
jgi:hypothetical protein